MEKSIKAVLESHFLLMDAKLTKLEGYDSINFKVEAGQEKYVLKKYCDSVKEVPLLRSENKILNALSGLKEWEFPVVISNSTGLPLSEEGEDVFRLLSFVEGDFLGDVEHTPGILRSLGRLLAEMDSTLIQLRDETIASRETNWDLRYFLRNRKYLDYIPDKKDRSLVDYFFLQYGEHVAPLEDELRKSIIHNDANDWNVLTKNGKVSGIIDFGDMCRSWLINELAVALAYVLMDKENPLEISLEVISAYHKKLPLQERELDILYYLIAARLCTSVCNSAYTKKIKPNSDYITISEKPAWELLKKWIVINPIKAKDEFRKAAGFPPTPKPILQKQLSKRNRYLGKSLSLSYDRPIEMYGSAFQYMYDVNGNTFLDAYNNIMLAGHCHPNIVRAGQAKMAQLNTNTRYVYKELLSYSAKLLAKFPEELNKVFFVNSGSAASDLAIRLATAHTGQNKIMVLEHGYHGNTGIGMDISHYKYSKNNGTGARDYVIQTPLPNAFGSGLADDETAGNHFAKHAIKKISEHQGKVAAFVAEPIAGCGGQVPLAKGYLQAVYPKIRAQGGVCISDEVQIGFGRLGDWFWGFEMHNVIPDIVIIGKPMGNGHPIGAVITTKKIAESFEQGPEFFSSFGGNPVSCAIGEAVLDVIKDENLQEHAKVVGNYLKRKLKALQNHFPQIAEVRGEGLFLGVELQDNNGKPNTDLAANVMNGLRERHILVSTDGPYNQVLKIKPPLYFNRKNVDTLVNGISEILTKT